MNYAIGCPSLIEDGYGYWDELLIAVLSSAASFFVIFIRKRCRSQTANNNSSRAFCATTSSSTTATAASLFSIKSCSFGSHIFKPSIAICYVSIDSKKKSTADAAHAADEPYYNLYTTTIAIVFTISIICDLEYGWKEITY